MTDITAAQIGLGEPPGGAWPPPRQTAGGVPKPEPRPAQEFPTGATRDQDHDKPDYEGFLSPLVIERYGQYMHGHRLQLDGKLRPSDNWQKGIPLDKYMKSLWRHFFAAWKLHRDEPHPVDWYDPYGQYCL